MHVIFVVFNYFTAFLMKQACKASVVYSHMKLEIHTTLINQLETLCLTYFFT